MPIKKLQGNKRTKVNTYHYTFSNIFDDGKIQADASKQGSGAIET